MIHPLNLDAERIGLKATKELRNWKFCKEPWYFLGLMFRKQNLHKLQVCVAIVAILRAWRDFCSTPTKHYDFLAIFSVNYNRDIVVISSHERV